MTTERAIPPQPGEPYFTPQQAANLLLEGTNRHLVRVERRLADELVEEYADRPVSAAEGGDCHRSERGTLAHRLAIHVVGVIEWRTREITTLRRRYAEFAQQIVAAPDKEVKRNYILNFAAKLGADEKELDLDGRAFERWFGEDTVTDRFQKLVARHERILAFALRKLGWLGWLTIVEDGAALGTRRLWNLLELEKVFLPLFGYEGDKRISTEAFRGMAEAVLALPMNERESALSAGSIRYIHRVSLEWRLDTAMQREVLRLLSEISPDSFVKAARARVTQPRKGDDLFVRRVVVEIAGKKAHLYPELVDVLVIAKDDPSPFVRQGVATAGALLDADNANKTVCQLGIQDSAREVRAQAVLAIETLVDDPLKVRLAAAFMKKSFEVEKDPFVLRTLLRVAVVGHATLASGPDHGVHSEAAVLWRHVAYKGIAAVRSEAGAPTSVRRWAAQAREQIWATASQEAQAVYEALGPSLRKLAVNETGFVKRHHFAPLSDVDEYTMGRALSARTQYDFGLDIGDGMFGKRPVTRGHVFSFRLWRFLHELRHPSTEKRQGFSHTIGRRFEGRIRIPSGILSELSQTRVPGEPLYLSREAGWRPYLPLMDEMLSALDVATPRKPVDIYTSEGVTRIVPPASTIGKFKAKLDLSRRYTSYATRRNWVELDMRDPSSYIQSLNRLGFSVTFTPHHDPLAGEASADPEVTRFFPAAGLAAFSPDDLYYDLQNYFFSLHENSLFELTLFSGLTMAGFVGRHVYVNTKIKEARSAIPLAIGGWGTRGKSGTERLKAALFNAMGYSVLSKTTGCEALFIHANEYGKLREMAIYRPYDKATIWEHGSVLRLAEKLKVDVFLWECMGLTPDYVRILQQDWMRDDLATITNTYPDHEDIQGPAGINIPEVMTNFIPPKSVLLTSEEQMLPILREDATKKKTEMVTVSWLQSGLLTPDILERFPYEEHPSNIALVLSMAQEMGIETDFALKEMADRVVPDIGVLKAFPVAPMRTRRLQFINGMSANERLGCMENWRRMGLDKESEADDPERIISGLVNNRADRVARSQVFASLMVNDVSVDRFYLVGDNLQGLMGYVRGALDEFKKRQSLFATGEGNEATPPSAKLETLARRLRVPLTPDAVRNRLEVMLKAAGVNPDQATLKAAAHDAERLIQLLAVSKVDDDISEDIQTWAGRLRDSHALYVDLAARVADRSDADATLDAALREAIDRWFFDKIVTVDDLHISGQKLVTQIMRDTPPGTLNRILGMQNIKGPGLSFVYRWKAWETAHKACADLRSGERGVAEQGLQELVRFAEYGPLNEEYVRETLAQVRSASFAQSERFFAGLSLVETQLNNAVNKDAHQEEDRRKEGIPLVIMELLERFFDAGDAVSRRKMANRIYDDMGTGRISHARASLELQGLNRRQKGGWFLERLASFRSALVGARK